MEFHIVYAADRSGAFNPTCILFPIGHLWQICAIMGQLSEILDEKTAIRNGIKNVSAKPLLGSEQRAKGDIGQSVFGLGQKR